MSLLVDMATLLSGVSSNIYYGDLPDTPDNVLVLYNTGGFDSLHNMTDVTAEQPTFQVRIRNTSYATAITQAESIKDALDGVATQTINSNLYISVFLQGDINSIGKDDRGRSNLTLNFAVRVKR